MAVGVLGEIDVPVSVEFMPTSPLATLEAAVELLEVAGDDKLGIVIDIWHFALSHSRWSTLEELPLERIGFIQLDDALDSAVGTSHDDSMHGRVLPGEGALPIGRFRDVLDRKGFDGVVSVEVLSQAWRERPIDDFVSATLKSSRQVWAG
jgi:sugar phosphate isomerase/epimerase